MAAPNARRRLLRALLAAFATPALARAYAGAHDAPAREPALPDRVGAPLLPWHAGCLDIHHIATGRGNATFVILPDGTSLLIDAGASANALDVSVAPRPNATRRAGEWIGRYALRQLRAGGLSAIDYLLVTHLHPDHLGDVTPASPQAARGGYRLTGVMDVAAIVPVGTLIDRGFPAYDYPSVFKAPFADNYRAFVAARVAAGERVEQFKVGSERQIAARGYRAAPAPFSVRNLAANGDVWSGQGDGAVKLFPELAQLPQADWPSENQCSTAIRIGYGKFAYFTAGDLTSYTDDGALPWRDMLGRAAHAAGPVSVATADHHGMFDGLNADVVRTLRPKAWVIPSWHIAHPDMLQLERMFSQRLYAGPRDVFATTVMPENLLANGRLTARMRSHDGHIVVRAMPGGARFYVAVTDNKDEEDRIRLITGLYDA
jgi:glyoxylase-like metal-dependent hydrolase (beta-lactamase superfamily II)